MHLDAQEPDDAPVRVTDEARALRDSSGRYQVLGEIGRGGVGVVFKGRDHDLGRDVAMKVLRDEYAKSPDVLARFVEEAQIGGQLQHPGIVPVYELGLQAGERPYFAMKLVKGETLAAQLARRASHTADRRRLLGVFEQVCQTVAYAHARRVIHRDLKPANVMIGAFGEVQVVDWGFAKVLPRGGVADEAQSAHRSSERSVIETVRSQPGSGSHSVAGSMMGTPAYMPPEQALGDVERMDARSDVFALGAILCEVLTGAPPYRKEDGDLVRQASVAALDGAFARLARCGADEALVGLCKECLAKARRARPESAAEVAARVGAYLTSVEERAREAELAATEARYRTRTTRITAAAALALVVLGAGTWVWVQGERQERRALAAQRVAAATSAASEARGRAQAAAPDDAATLWDTALSGAQQAAALARADDADPGARAEVEALLTTVEAERDAAAAEAARLERDREMLARLESLRMPTDEDVRVAGWNLREARRLDAAYSTAFADYLGVASPLELPAEEALASLRRGDIEVELATSLDHWAVARDAQGAAEPEVDGAETARIRELASRLDPDDPWRTTLRALLPAAEREGERLRALADSADFASVPAAGCRVLGVVLWSAGQNEAAVVALRRAQEAHPQDFDLCFLLALFLEQLDRPRWREALDTYRIAHALRPDHDEVLHRMGLVLKDHLGRHADAERVFRRLNAKHSDDMHWLSHLAATIDGQGRSDEAMELYEELRALGPYDGFAHKWVGAAYYRRRQYAKARQHFERAIALIPEDPGAQSNFGNVLARYGDFAEAERYQRSAVELDPRNVIYLNNLAETLSQMGRLEEAAALCHDGLRVDPDEPNTHTNLGNILRNQGELEEAIASFERALDLDPEFVTAHLGLGLTRERQGRLAEAVTAYDSAMALDPEHPGAHNNLGRARVLQGDIPGGIAAYRRAIQLDPNQGVFHANLGFALFHSRQPAEAIEAFDRALELGTGRNEPNVRCTRGRALGMVGRTEDAVASLEHALDLDPKLHEALWSLGAVYAGAGDPHTAIVWYQRALELDSEDATTHYNLAVSLESTGDWDGVLEHYRRATDLSHDFPEAWWGLGRTLGRAGENDEARRALLRAAELLEAARRPGWELSAASARRSAEALDRRVELEDVLTCRREARSPEEWAQAVEFAHGDGRYAEIVDLTEETLENTPQLLGNPSWHTYNSACAAGLLSAEPEASSEERARARPLAHAWLTREVERWGSWIASGERTDEARRRLARALEDPDFESLRGEALVVLPEAERTAWQDLWSSIAALLEEERR